MNQSDQAQRSCGVAVPLPAIRTSNGWCVGEYPDLAELGMFCQKSGMDLIQLLPLNDTGRQSSPYAALSAFALHPMFLRVADIPEAAGHPDLVAGLKTDCPPVSHQRFDYYQAYDAKLSVLRSLYEREAESLLDSQALREFATAHSWLKTYAVYKVLKDRNGDRSWRDWTNYRYPTSAAIEALWQDEGQKRAHWFHVWLQYHCDRQLRTASSQLLEKGIRLLGDIPILMNDDSAEVWADRQLFHMHLRAGAPPEHDGDTGQSWGFPIYNWEVLAARDYAFWRQRVAHAGRYYSAYRIDHVLGFFRIWAIPEFESDGWLGYYFPGLRLSADELSAVGCTPERVRWLAQPHTRGADIRNVLSHHGMSLETLTLPRQGQPDRIPVFAQLPGEDLFLFHPEVKGTAHLETGGFPASLLDFLKQRWRDRCLVTLPDATYVPVSRFWLSTSWNSLSGDEKQRFEALFGALTRQNNEVWRDHGRTILKILCDSSSMLPCAEDLGAIPPCVPEVLGELGILGLRIPRWTRRYDQPGAPFLRPEEYPLLSVCALSVHDTSTFRAWWNQEDGREGLFQACLKTESASSAALDPATQLSVMRALSSGTSAIFVAQLQDYTDLMDRYRSADPIQDRVNVPGTLTDANWTWHMSPTVETLAADDGLLALIKQIARRS